MNTTEKLGAMEAMDELNLEALDEVAGGGKLWDRFWDNNDKRGKKLLDACRGEEEEEKPKKKKRWFFFF